MSIAQLLLRKWWVVTLQGVLLIILSIYIFQHPVAVLAGISFWFGVMVLGAGALGIVSWLVAARSEREGISLLWSILTAALGLMMLLNMLATMKTVTLIFGLWMLLTALHLASNGWAAKSRSGLGWVMVVTGVLSGVAAVMMMFNMGTAAVGVSTLLGLQVLLTGIAMLLLSMAKKVLGDKLKARSAT